MNRRACCTHTFVATAALGALTLGGLASAPNADASCASFFGIGNTAECTSNLTSIAIAIGTNATAKANGLFGAAFAVGTNAGAQTDGPLSFATAVGDGSAATTDSGALSVALAGGVNASASAGQATPYAPASVGNVAVALCTKDCIADSRGIANVAINLFGDTSDVGVQGSATVAADVGGTESFTSVYGNFSNALSLFGTKSNTSASSMTVAFLSTAFTIGSRGTGSVTQVVQAGPGPFAIAGSIFQTDAIVTKAGPGFNINGIAVGGASALGKRSPQSGSAAKTSTSNSTKKAAGRSGSKSTGGSAR
ncbi:hypothetical protein [Mycobacterium sp. M26]|uniref:hypothetical protein n=1 Tax=Mycobacterium sp. M26 TaxID=1762962 RepID=UPI00073E9375|nr:hypothetical protein [Mycobacterium sp. M26]